MAAERHKLLEIYKKGQGTRARLGSLIGLLIFVGYGCYSLGDMLAARQIGRVNLSALSISYGWGIGAGVFVILGLAIAYLLNLPRVADFLIATEGELRKVSWPTRDDLMRQTIVVVIVMVVMLVVIFLFDLVASQSFERVLPK